MNLNAGDFFFLPLNSIIEYGLFLNFELHSMAIIVIYSVNASTYIMQTYGAIK